MNDVELVPLPASGRVFTGVRRVRLGDASPGGRLRFDALVRYLQDVSNDDTRDAGLVDEMAWIVRRTVIEVRRFAELGESLTLRTFCGGTGGRWAERRVGVTGDQGASIEAATLWVHLDEATQRPKPLPQQFHDLYGEAAGGRTVRARLLHDDVPRGLLLTAPPWPLRFSDFDVLGHVNNAAYWEVVEEHLARRRDLRAPLRAELEFRAAVEQGQEVVVAVEDTERSLRLWLVGPAGTSTTALVRGLT